MMALAAALLAIGTHAALPAGGGLDAVDVSVDASAGVLRVKRGSAAVKEIKIPIQVDASKTSIDTIAIGGGKNVLRVRVPDGQRKDLAFEAIVAGSADEPLFSGVTGYSRGDEGDRNGDIVLVHDGTFVVVAETREDTRICGQAVTPLAPRVLDPATMTLRGATLHRLDAKERGAATKIIAARATTKAPLARVLAPTGGSAPGAPRIADGKSDTTWSEQRGGDGHGEFVTMRAPAELPLYGLTLTITPPNAPPNGAAPRTFFVATDEKLFQVTMPEDAWSKPGQTYDVPFPAPVKTQCLAVVLDDAYARGLPAPEVQIAEVSARTKFDADGATLDDVVKELSGPRAQEAAALLKRSGDDGLTAVMKQYDSLEGPARAFAVDVAASTGACDGAAADLLTTALGDRDVEVKRRATGRIERCGKAAGIPLARAVRSDDEARRAAAAPLLAAVAPSVALEPLGEQMGKGSPETRRAVRAAYARAANVASPDKLHAALAKREAPVVARIDLLRATSAKLPGLRPDSAAAIADLLKGAPDLATRYLLVPPLAALARSPDATSGELSRLAELAQRDPDWPVRARAVELSSGIAPLAPTILAATADREPRVREAAFRAIASSSLSAGAPRAAEALAHDPWTFVRIAAAEALGATPQEGSNALVVALEDPSPKVRSAVLGALAKQRATRAAPKIRERLDDAKEDPEVRALAARALGQLCDKSALDRLTKLALLARAPVDEADDRIGVAAIEALGALHPADLEKRLAPLRAKDVRLPVRRATERAIAEQGACR